MNWRCDEARLSAEEIAEINHNMEARGLSHVFCKACSEEMKPEQARKSSTGLIMCRQCFMCNDTDATQDEIDQTLEENFPGYPTSITPGYHVPYLFCQEPFPEDDRISQARDYQGQEKDLILPVNSEQVGTSKRCKFPCIVEGG